MGLVATAILEHFMSYNSLYDYIADIKHAIADGHIIAAKEYYSQLRLKGSSKSGVLMIFIIMVSITLRYGRLI